ncbi:MAG: response regulator [Crocinitomicaceae bacterium]|nr:response regulator [Crocinitomicaceae bacterium]
MEKTTKKRFGHYQIRYAIYGVLFGAGFPVIGTLIQCSVLFDQISWDFLMKSQQETQMLWIIDSAPFFLGLFASFGGLQMDRVQSKNEELQERYYQMSKLRELAEEGNKAKSSFLANMSHEIRTPMNAIIGLSYLVLKGNLENKQRGQIEKIQLSSESLMRIIDDILDFSKIEAGELSFELGSFELERTMNDVTDVANVKLKSKREIEFIIEYDQEIPTMIIGDQLRLRQVLINLLDNAVKFTEQGDIKLTCKLVKKTDNGVFIHFSISDSGIGISKDQIETLFSPFHQADISTTRKYGGTGLGLVICKRLINMMQGEISVTSNLGEGSTFSFDAFFESAPSSIVPVTEKKGLKDLKVLLVDDSDSARTVLGDMLQSFGFNVFEASSAEEGIAIFRTSGDNDPFSLVVADWFMPDMDGLELIEELQKEVGQSSSILMVTAFGADNLREASRSNLIDSYLLKPISPSILFDAIQNTFTKKNFTGTSNLSDPLNLEYYKSKLEGLKVLLVEDNEINMELATELLKDVGLGYKQAINGQKALEILQEEEFDGVLMDIQMPVMDGLTATKEIRKIQKFKELPIIAMTAHALTGERAKSLASGMNVHINKPINPELLYQTLINFLDVDREREKKVEDVQSSYPKEVKDEEFPKIVGINTVDGLKRAGGKHGLYKKVLIDFARSNKFIEQDISKLTELGSSTELSKLLHNIAGVCGNIGATKQYMSAISLSVFLKEINEEDFASKKDQLIKVAVDIQQIVKNIDESLEDSAKERSRVLEDIDAKNLNKLLNTISTLVEDNDPSSVELLEEALDKHSFSRYNLKC